MACVFIFPLPSPDSRPCTPQRLSPLGELFGALRAAATDGLPLPSVIYLLGFHLLVTTAAFSFPLSLLQRNCQFKFDD